MNKIAESLDQSQRNYLNRDEVDDILPLQNLLPLDELEREDGEKEIVEEQKEIPSIVVEKEEEVKVPPATVLDIESEMIASPEASGGYSDGEV